MDNLLIPQKKLLYSIGFTFDESENRVWRFYSWMLTICLILSMIPQIVFVYVNVGDIQMATDSLCTLFYCVIALPKLIVLQLLKPKLYRYFRVLRLMSKTGKYM